MKFRDDISNKRIDTQAETNLLPTFSKLGHKRGVFEQVI